MGLKRIFVGGAVALALVGAGAAAAVQVRNNIHESQGVQRLTDMCRDINQNIHDNGVMVKVSSGDRTVIVLGDSYAAADFLDQPSDGWVSQLGKSEGWATSVSGIGGTGFINGGPCGTQQFSSRIPEVLDSKPSLVIVEGGLNDHGKPVEAIERSVSALLDSLAEVPEVVVVGPTDAPAITDDAEVDAVMKKSVESKGRTYVSAYRWNLPFLPDGVHLTEDGHASYAKQLSAAIP